MALVNDDISLIDKLPDNKSKKITLHCYKQFKSNGYHPHINIPDTNTKKYIHFYDNRNDYKKIQASYGITINISEDNILFYFRKNANKPNIEELKNNFGIENVNNNPNTTNGHEITVKIYEISKLDLLVNKYLKS